MFCEKHPEVVITQDCGGSCGMCYAEGMFSTPVAEDMKRAEKLVKVSHTWDEVGHLKWVIGKGYEE